MNILALEVELSKILSLSKGKNLPLNSADMQLQLSFCEEIWKINLNILQKSIQFQATKA